MTLPSTENVAIATIMAHVDRAYRELSNGASPNFLSFDGVEIKWYESFTLKYIKKMNAMATFLKRSHPKFNQFLLWWLATLGENIHGDPSKTFWQIEAVNRQTNKLKTIAKTYPHSFSGGNYSLVISTGKGVRSMFSNSHKYKVSRAICLLSAQGFEHAVGATIIRFNIVFPCKQVKQDFVLW